LVEISADFVPVDYEAVFSGTDELIIRDGNDYFRLHGQIDRIDQASDTSVRIIDYKTGAPTDFNAKAIRAGEKLQLPLYALAVQEALQLGEPVDGFYWHVQQGEPSPGTLRDFKDGAEVGPSAAIKLATEKAWEAVRGARVGNFEPHPPRRGCPSHCPVTGFCWHYRPRFGD
jgi:RecB family exonuclease